MAIKNLNIATKRLKKAVKTKERIILYGDADLDGVCSVIVLQEALKSLGSQIAKTYFPDREKDGYGITKKALKEFKELVPALLCALDLGISNFKEVDEARKIGFEVMIIDHHEVLDRLPRANIIVDPKQPGDKHPFKALAASGLAFKIAQELLKGKMSPSLQRSLLELAALGTLADMVPREKDNKIIIEEGLESLRDSWRPGIRAFFQIPEFSSLATIESKLQKMISILNVRDVKDGSPASFRVLTALSEREAMAIVENLLVLNERRKELTQELLERVRSRIEKTKHLPLVFEGGASFEYILLGTIASVICREEDKPTFIFKKRKTESIGSVRAPSGFDTVEAMKHCSKVLETYGGHAQASGFRVENRNLEKFKTCLTDYFNHSA